MASPTQINIAPADDSRLRQVEIDQAVTKSQVADHDRVIGAIESHLGELTKAFHDYRIAAAAEFSKFQVRALCVAVLVFASSENADRIIRVIGLG